MLDLTNDEKQMIMNALNIAAKAEANTLEAGYALRPIAMKIQESMAPKKRKPKAG